MTRRIPIISYLLSLASAFYVKIFDLQHSTLDYLKLAEIIIMGLFG